MELPSVLAPQALQELQTRVMRTPVAPELSRYLVELDWQCRSIPEGHTAISPRCLLVWQRVAQAWAYLHQRPYVIPDDIQTVARPVLAVRSILPPDEFASFVQSLLNDVSVPI